MTKTTFAALRGVTPAVAAALSGRGITAPFPIQEQVIPLAADGHDVLAQAPTGSGKTLAFGLPLIAACARAAEVDHAKPSRSGRNRGGSLPPRSVRGLVLVPTRELAVQVGEELNTAAIAHGLRIATVYGGAGIGRQVSECRTADIVVATPGRLNDLLDRGDADLSRVSVLVLDEADRMLDMGFAPQVDRIARHVPDDRQTMLFSATLDGAVSKLVERYTTDPKTVCIEPITDSALAIDHYFMGTTRDTRIEDLLDELDEPRDLAVIFVRTKHGADRLAKNLRKRGVAAGALHGGMTQSRRLRELGSFRAGTITVLVATDVFARGIDLDNITCVINYDPPEDADTYRHRVGRTGRAGRSGIAVSLIAEDQWTHMLAIADAMGIRDEVDPPQQDDAPATLEPEPIPDDGIPRGTVKFFHGRKGYGFIAPADGSADVFVHHSNITGGSELDEGMRVRYELAEGSKGPEARAVCAG